jgi:flavin-dependent dehydrogenase
MNRRVAIAGCGPAGATLASLLAARGVDVAVFNGGKRPPLLVGESLIPAIIPLLRELGVEDEVAAISRVKPGATFYWQQDWPVVFDFTSVEGILPTYAYNVPRPAFDRILEERARRGGARWIEAEARLAKSGEGKHGELSLGEESLARVPDWEGKQPDVIVDASGRRRRAAGLLDIPARLGPRKDVAIFAHYKGWDHGDRAGQIQISRRAAGNGWHWQIPLSDRMSVGAVLHADAAAAMGGTAEEKLENAIASDPLLAERGTHRWRVSEAAVYANYQLISQRGAGRGWASTGDAFGFVDPMLSPGLRVAMYGARMLADAILAWKKPGLLPAEAFDVYGKRMIPLLEAWQAIIRRFYDGSIMAAYATGMSIRERFPGRLSGMMRNHVQRHFAAMACGADTEKRHRRGMMDFPCSHPRGYDPAAHAIA